MATCTNNHWPSTGAASQCRSHSMSIDSLLSYSLFFNFYRNQNNYRWQLLLFQKCASTCLPLPQLLHPSSIWVRNHLQSLYLNRTLWNHCRKRQLCHEPSKGSIRAISTLKAEPKETECTLSNSFKVQVDSGILDCENGLVCVEDKTSSLGGRCVSLDNKLVADYNEYEEFVSAETHRQACRLPCCWLQHFVRLFERHFWGSKVCRDEGLLWYWPDQCWMRLVQRRLGMFFSQAKKPNRGWKELHWTQCLLRRFKYDCYYNREW
jgi:hypothetical protein